MMLMSVSHTEVLSILEMEHQVMYTTVNKPWDPGGTGCLRLHINDLYATEMERCGGRESDCVCAVTSKATDSVEDTCVFSKRD